MSRFRRATIGTVTATLVASGMILFTGASAEAGTVTVKLRGAINNLPVAGETRSGYDRGKFRHWIDANGDCQDARSEVLRAETRSRISGSCTVQTGRWLSYYDGATWTQPSDVDVDHMVPLAEAWDSGAKRWTTATRKAYANDIGDGRTLVAVTDNVNQSKGDRDPAEWLPQQRQCRYVAQWVAVKIRWSLKVDRSEKNALSRVAGSCDNVRITVTKASIRTGGSSTGGSGDGSSSGGGSVYYANCDAARAAGAAPVRRGDPGYASHLDRDNDGVGCE